MIRSQLPVEPILVVNSGSAPQVAVSSLGNEEIVYEICVAHQICADK